MKGFAAVGILLGGAVGVGFTVGAVPGGLLGAAEALAPPFLYNNPGGPGGQLVGLWGSSLCWTTWGTFFGHNGSLFWSGIDDGGEAPPPGTQLIQIS